ncbi:hypothetical protein TARUN_4676 [Trichoderma arundinaceum]|uniref:Uncharacterized protein n=1 Tax=Trichoderma arundinaceum TaxID=490622 RepID=A0A395NN96_TRIAR|nr:hypothetical protein TARUN_4676 [Trichoderma arundinaceum]
MATPDAVPSQEVMPPNPSQSTKSVSFASPLESTESTRPEDRILPRDDSLTQDDIRELLPATFRNGKAWVGCPDVRVRQFLAEDHNIDRLKELLPFFFMLGNVEAPRPLNYQEAVGLDIVITERMDTHLLCDKDKIFIKPLPRYLLEPEFWDKFFGCPQNCYYAGEFEMLNKAKLLRSGRRFTAKEPCEHTKVWKRAKGFVYSYTALIAHESDFEIARAKRLVPDDLEFHHWKDFVSRMLDNGKIYRQIDERFAYGELNLSRINKLFMFQHPVEYLFQTNNSTGLFQDHISRLSSVSIYVVVVLASIRVAAVIAKLREKKALLLVTYGSITFFLVGLITFWMLISE